MHNTEKSSLLDVIKCHPEGIKEYDLMKLVQEKQPPNKGAQFDNLDLFKRHFLLFHTLYQLDDQLRSEKNGQLIIGVLKIQWLPQNEERTDDHSLYLAQSDPLRDFYLELKNLEDTTSEDVENLLASFWLKMGDDSEKTKALALFELDESCDFPIIKKRYRQLLSTHHPDKGGCVIKTQTLNDAMTVLKRCYAET
ncbi:hypothetical protein N8878_07060 [Psychromonas sp.]|nr:hypothetical protein [Psychromonas sp.]